MRRLRLVAVCAAVPLVLMGLSATTAQAKCINCYSGGSGGEITSDGTIMLYENGHDIECKGDRYIEGEGWVNEDCVQLPNGTGCSSPDQPEFQIETYPLGISFEAISGFNTAEAIVGIEMKPLKGTKFATFQCGSVRVEVKGAVIGPVTPVLTLVTPPEGYTAVFAQNEGHQAVTKFEGKKTTTQLMFRASEEKKGKLIKGKWVPGAIESIETITYPEPTELRPIERKKK